MQRLGLAMHVSPSQSIILKTERAPKIGETVVDEDLKPVGRVFDVFGPVSSPYVAVRPSLHEAERLVGKRLYVVPSKRRKERKWSE